MQRDAGDQAPLDLVPDVAEADVIEQSLPVRAHADGADGPDGFDPLPADANPDDVVEQRLEVPFDDDDYPTG
jgi:hypothetical protein